MGLINLIKKDSPAKPIVYDESFGVGFNIKHILKSELNKLTSQYTKLKFNAKTHQKDEELDVEGLRKRICEMCVTGWFKVTYRWLGTLAPLDLEQIEDIDAEIPFTQENLSDIMEIAYGLDGWVFETVRNASLFGEERKEDELKN